MVAGAEMSEWWPWKMERREEVGREKSKRKKRRRRGRRKKDLQQLRCGCGCGGEGGGEQGRQRGGSL